MDRAQLIGEVAKRHGLLLDEDDPILVAITLNELVLEEALKRTELALLDANVAAKAAAAQRVEEARQTAAELLARTSTLAAEGVRRAGDEVRARLAELLDEHLPKPTPPSPPPPAHPLWPVLFAWSACSLAAGLGLGWALFRP